MSDRPLLSSIAFTPSLPLELKFHIVSFMDTSSLLATCRASQAMSLEAERYLYHDVTLFNTSQIKRFHDALAKDKTRAAIVRKCTFTDFDAHHRTLVHCVLKSLSNLSSLSIVPSFDKIYNHSWDALFVGCEFKLVEFTTSFDCDRGLVDFLVKQQHIERYSHSGYTPTHTIGRLGPPVVLPFLKRLHGNIVDLNIVIPSRPVTHVIIEETIAAIGLESFVLQPLASSRGPVEYLSLSLCDPVTSHTLSLIQTYTPDLQSLDLSSPRENIQVIAERSWGIGLAGFKRLKSLTAETSLSSEGRSWAIPLCDQNTLVHLWHQSCASLRIIRFQIEKLVIGDQIVDEWTFLRGKWCYSQHRVSIFQTFW